MTQPEGISLKLWCSEYKEDKSLVLPSAEGAQAKQEEAEEEAPPKKTKGKKKAAGKKRPRDEDEED